MTIRRTPQRIQKVKQAVRLPDTDIGADGFRYRFHETARRDAAVESVQMLTQLSVRDETALAVYAGYHAPRHATASELRESRCGPVVSTSSTARRRPAR
jgi:hypothetical protein